MIGAARAEINPHPGLDPLIPGLTRDLLRKTRMRLRVKPAMRGGKSIIAESNEKWKIIKGL